MDCGFARYCAIDDGIKFRKNVFCEINDTFLDIIFWVLEFYSLLEMRGGEHLFWCRWVA